MKNRTLVGSALLAAGVVLALPMLGLDRGAAALAQAAGASDKKAEPKNVADVSASQKIIYRVDLTGEFGRTVTATPLQQVMEEAKKWNPDYLVFYVNMAFGGQGQNLKDWQGNPRMTSFAFNQLETARELQTMLTDKVLEDDNWKTRDGKKPELIMWVRKAMGGAAFLPFVAPKIYYTADAHHGGIGYLDHIFDGVGDWEVREKQYSLRLARAIGLAEKGGHEGKLVRAMARLDYVLSVSYLGGKPVFFEDYGGDELLSDDGDPDAGRADSPEEIIRMEGNDVLTLNADSAMKLGLGAGRADNIDDLATELGISRDFVVVKGRSAEIFTKWSKDVGTAERDFARLWREFDRTPIEGETASDRNRGRSKRISILNKISDLLKRYKEAINPREIKGAPEQWESRIDVLIAEIRQAMRLDK